MFTKDQHGHWELTGSAESTLTNCARELLRKHGIERHVFNIHAGTLGVTLDVPSAFVRCVVEASTEISPETVKNVQTEFNNIHPQVSLSIS